MTQKGALKQFTEALNSPTSIFSVVKSPRLKRTFSRTRVRSMSDEVQEFGVAVIGCGIAGKVRIRDLTSNTDMPELSKVKLRGIVTRQDMQMVGADKLSLDTVLRRNDIHALLICTENGRHETLARQGLEAGKHVLVEYPLATNGKAAAALYELAREKGVILYEEDISLLTPGYEVAKMTVMAKELLSAELSFTANYGHGWLDNFEESGSLLVTSMNNVHWLVDLFGELKPVSCVFVNKDSSASMIACMETKDGKPVKLSITRDRSFSGREKKMNFRFTDGTVLDELPALNKNTSGPGLFLRDFFQFHQACLGLFGLEAWNRRSLYSLQLCDELNKMAGL